MLIVSESFFVEMRTYDWQCYFNKSVRDVWREKFCQECSNKPVYSAV